MQVETHSFRVVPGWHAAQHETPALHLALRWAAGDQGREFRGVWWVKPSGLVVTGGASEQMFVCACSC